MFAAETTGSTGGLVGFVLDVIDRLGEVGVGFLVLLESVIPPIPSDVVLPAAGILISLDRLNGPLTFLWAMLGSISGALILYSAGRAFGEQRTRKVLLAVPLVDACDVDRADASFARRGEIAVLVGASSPGCVPSSHCLRGRRGCRWARSCCGPLSAPRCGMAC